MAVQVVPLLTTLWDADNTTGWSTTPTLFNDRQREGAGCLGLIVSNTTTHTWETIAPRNLTNQGVYIWFLLAGAPATRANGGARIVLGDGTNRRAYFVGGSDFSGFQINAWSSFMIDTANLPTQFQQLQGASQPNLNAITEVGVGFTTTQKAVGGVANCFWDIGRHGTGLKIIGGTPASLGTFKEIADDDRSIASGKAYGIIREIQPGLYGVQGGLIFGDDTGTTSTYFKDNNVNVVFEANGASNNLYYFNVRGNTTGTNSFVLGDKLGTGDGASGINGVTISSSGVNVKIDFTNPNVNTLNIFGTTFLNTRDFCLLSNNINHEIITSTFNRVGRVTLNSLIIRSCNFINTFSTVSAVLWGSNTNIRNCDFIGNTSASIEHVNLTQNPFDYNNLIFSSNTFDVRNNSGNQIIVNKVNGSNPTTFTGSSVIFILGIMFTLADLVPDTEVRIYRTSDRVELAGVESSANEFTYMYNYVNDINVYVVIHKETREYISLNNIILTNINTRIPIQQRPDRNYIS